MTGNVHIIFRGGGVRAKEGFPSRLRVSVQIFGAAKPFPSFLQADPTILSCDSSLFKDLQSVVAGPFILASISGDRGRAACLSSGRSRSRTSSPL